MNRSVATFLLLAGLAGAYCATFGRLRLAAIADHHRSLDAAYQRHELAAAGSRQLPELLEATEELAQLSDQLTARLRPDPLAPPPVLALSRAVKADGLQVDRAEAMPPDSQLALPNHRVRLAVTGTLASLFTALRDLENTALPTRVTEFSVRTAADGRNVQGELVVAQAWSAPQ